MYPTMHSKVRILRKRFPTIITLVGFLLGVSTHVRLQMDALYESFIANFAFMRSDPFVNQFVRAQGARLSESLVADIA